MKTEYWPPDKQQLLRTGKYAGSFYASVYDTLLVFINPQVWEGSAVDGLMKGKDRLSDVDWGSHVSPTGESVFGIDTKTDRKKTAEACSAVLQPAMLAYQCW